MNTKYNEPMNKHTTFKIGGPAAVFAEPSDSNELIEIIKKYREENTLFMVIGRGSNILFPDEGVDRAVISTMGMNKIHPAFGAGIIKAEAGALLKNIAEQAMEQGLTGFEFAYGIPGTLGGAVRMNAGAHGGDISQVFRSALVMDENGGITRMFKDEMEFGYRESILSTRDLIVLECELIFEKGDRDTIKDKMNAFMDARNAKQPVDKPSAGSVFKRPGDGIYAAALIEECGLKGFFIGGAQVSDKHSGFIINTGDGTAADVRALIEYVKGVVFKEKGILLETEVIIV